MFGIPIGFQSQRKKIVKSVHKQEIGPLWSSESFEVKYNIRFGISIEFPNQRRKKYSNQSIGRLKILVHRKLNKISYFNIIFVEKQIILSVIRVILFKIEYDIIQNNNSYCYFYKLFTINKTYIF